MKCVPVDSWKNCDRYPELTDIPGSSGWLRLAEIDPSEPLRHQYAVLGQNDQQFLIRVSERTSYDRVKNEFEHLKMLRKSGVPAPDPVGFGFCDNGRSLYLQTRWINGRSLESKMPDIRLDRQYELGTRAGLLLKIVHNCPVSASSADWQKKFEERCRRVLESYQVVKEHFAAIQRLARMVRAGRAILFEKGAGRPACLLHGSFSPENIILSPDWEVFLSHLSNWQYGDPLQDLAGVLTRIRSVSVPFAIGMLDCYFVYKPDNQSMKLICGFAALELLERFLSVGADHEHGHVEENEAASSQSIREQISRFCEDMPGDKGGCPLWYKRIKKASQYECG